MRLTKTDERFGYYYNGREDEIEFDVLSKLGQLEDIEEELGIDLITLLKNKSFKELFKEVWIRDKRINKKGEAITYIHKARIYSYKDYLLVYSNDCNDTVCRFEIKDYGKNWALTEKELL